MLNLAPSVLRLLLISIVKNYLTGQEGNLYELPDSN